MDRVRDSTHGFLKGRFEACSHVVSSLEGKKAGDGLQSLLNVIHGDTCQSRKTH